MTIAELRNRNIRDLVDIFKDVAQIESWHCLLERSLPHLVRRYSLGDTLSDLPLIDRYVCSLAALILSPGTRIERTLFLLDDPWRLRSSSSLVETLGTYAEENRTTLTSVLGQLLAAILQLGGSVVVTTRFVPDELQLPRGEKKRFSFPLSHVYLKIEEHEPTRHELERARRNPRVLAGLFRSVLSADLTLPNQYYSGTS